MLITLLQIFGAALTAGVFTLLGVWISQHGAVEVVKWTFESQMALVKDAAIRDYRKQQVKPYIEATKHRFYIWYEMHLESGIEDKAKLLQLQAQLTSTDFNSMIVTYVEIPDKAFRKAFQEFVNADGMFRSTYTSKEIMTKIKSMQLALAELSKVSEDYIFSK